LPSVERNMSRFLVKTAAFLASFTVALGGCHRPSDSRGRVPAVVPLRIDGVTVVDTLDGKLTPDMSILMEHGEIVAITPTAKTLKVPGLSLVDGTGKFVVPGYNNMHVHVLDQTNASALLALMLTEGVTGFRQMSGSPELLAQRRDGKLPIGKDAPALLAMPGSVLTPFNASSRQQMQSEIQQQKLDGADFIKVAILDPQIFFAAIAESKSVGLPIVGHLQEGVNAAQASEEGFRSIEHLGPGDTIWISCSTDQAALLAEAAQHPVMKAPRIRIPDFIQKMAVPWIQKRLINPAAFEDAADVARLQRALDTYDEKKCRRLIELFVANNTWQVPTLVRLRTQELADSPEYLADPALRIMEPAAVQKWREVTDQFHKLPQTSLATFREAYSRQLALTKLFDDVGVKMMTGTDDGGQVPGQSLQQEFAELAKAGLSPLKILQMTTIAPAIFLGRTTRMGTIQAGKNADLVLLDANPIASVQNLGRIYGVVRAGSYYSRGNLSALRGQVEAGHGRLY
jgi:Amidohydrolase family